MEVALKYFGLRINFPRIKSKNPKWFPLDTELLDSYEFDRLTDAQKWHLICLLKASIKYSNVLVMDLKWLRNVLQINSKRFSLEPFKPWIFAQNHPEMESDSERDKHIPTPLPPTAQKSPKPEKSGSRRTARKPSSRNGLDMALTELIDHFISEAKTIRGKTVVPQWGKAKAQIRPHIKAKGLPRVKELATGFLRAQEDLSNELVDQQHPHHFGANLVTGQPLTIQGLIAAIPYLEKIYDKYETEEKPFQEGR